MQQSSNSKIIELLFDFFRHIKGNLTIKAEFTNLSMLQMQALLFISTNPNSTMSTIAKHFTIELPSATSLVNKLHKLGLVERRHEKEDRRKVCIVLTGKGVELFKEAKKIREQHIENILSYLSETEKEQMEKILGKICKSIEEKYE